jgi:hypothetical protein
VIVIVTVPVGAVAAAVKTRVLVAVAGFGLKEAVTPFGSPDADSATVDENPFFDVMVIVFVP